MLDAAVFALPGSPADGRTQIVCEQKVVIQELDAGAPGPTLWAP